MTTTPRVDALIEIEIVRELKAEIALLRKVVMAESWQASRAVALEEAAALVAAMTISPTDIILCADTIDEAAARIRAMVKP